MGFEVGTGNGSLPWGIRTLMRRKQVDSIRGRAEGGHHQLAKELSVLQLIAIGVGSTIGAGVYVLVGTVAREHTGPALTISFLIAGIAAALSAFCYAELASRCPSAGSAYHYSYICVGEGVAWLIGWALILEYTIGGSAVARGISPNLALLFGGPDSLPSIFARSQIPGLDIVVDPCAAFLVLIVTALLCVGIKESSFVQAIVTTANVCVMIFVVVAGAYLGFKTGWVGYSVASGYFPYGVKNPQRDLPLGIGVALSVCCILYMLVSIVVIGLVPYFAMDPDTPISSAFASHGMQWAVYVITAGAILALCATLMGSILPQPRILMAMSRDGLLPPFFADVNKKTQVPVKSTIMTGVCAAALAFFMDVSQLAGMVSVGTLLAFTIVAVSILILRYVPPEDVPLPSSLHGSIDSVSSQYSALESGVEKQTDKGETSHTNDVEASPQNPLIVKENDQGFICPFVPLLPVCSILINVYLLINLGGGTWMRVSVWLAVGVLVYLFYGRTHSSLTDAVYVPASQADEIYRSSESTA
ncbi:hypothetical protein Taro_037903 [Colocasia esculenta]|uniref:Cationic amino acid transporter C-terminal domain-containing protein n=1 Tax=Colocasia esculenta TaxID=4460 RepID=A0A843WM25_COLES|nr:hypothetical protein [Colocasia esculenta]